MNKVLPRPITPEEKETYRRDGIVCLRGLFDADWVALLRDLVERDMQSPSDMFKNINEDSATGFFFGDTFVWQHIPEFRDFIFESPAAEAVAQSIGSQKLNLVFDQILAKEPNTSSRTTWHHDATYWPVAGDMIATLWIALDPVSRETGAVEYIVGSHRWGQRFKAVSFDPNEQYEEGLPPVPDIDAQRDQYTFACFDMAPGDCTLHHGLTVHGAPGNASSNVRRRAYITRWAGDDVTYNPRPKLQRMKRDPGIEAGAALDCELFPVVRQ